MKIKTADLVGPALDWAVAKAAGKEISMTYSFGSHTHYRRTPWCDKLGKPWEPSASWSQGGPLIDVFKVSLEMRHVSGEVIAKAVELGIAEGPSMAGEDHLVAAMRAIVAFRLGKEVDIPDELQ